MNLGQNDPSGQFLLAERETHIRVAEVEAQTRLAELRRQDRAESPGPVRRALHRLFRRATPVARPPANP